MIGSSGRLVSVVVQRFSLVVWSTSRFMLLCGVCMRTETLVHIGVLLSTLISTYSSKVANFAEDSSGDEMARIHAWILPARLFGL